MSSLLLSLLLPLAVTPVPDIFQPGPHKVDHVHINREIFGSLDHALDVYAPHTEGEFPVIMFFPGLALTLPASSYSTILTHIASWGYVVLGPSALLYDPGATYRAEWVQPVLDWAYANIHGYTDGNNGLHPGLTLDFSQLYLGAQSSGSHVAVEFLKQRGDCQDVQGMFLLSPVDGMDPYGLIPVYCITPGELLNFKIPTLIISGGLDAIPGIGQEGGIMPACAPRDMGSARFYSALAGPTLLLNATDYGHIDCMDQYMIDIVQVIHGCKSDESTDKDTFRQEVAGQVLAFLSYVTQGDCSLWSWMSGLEDTGTGVDTQVDWKGGMQEACGQPGCSWQEGSIRSIHL